MQGSKKLGLVILSGFFLVSCVSNRVKTSQAIYFKNISDSLLQKTAMEYEPVFQKGDILSIGVITPNERSARLFNQTSGALAVETETTAATNQSQGYLISENGTITFPYVGHLKAAGLTRLQLTDTLSRHLRTYIDSAIVTVRLLNYRITVLGEVMKPGTYSIPSERVSILDAIGLAGDLTVYGKRSNIRIIRHTDGVRQTATLDINKGDIFGSPFFYLRQNDVVYVEMNDRKIPNADQASIRQASIVLGIISAIGVIVSTINVLRN
jgi:polysaccharide biosynthesis/export protein